MTRTERSPVGRRPRADARPTPRLGTAPAVALLAAIAFLLISPGPASAQDADPCLPEPIPCLDPGELPVPETPLPDVPVDPGELPVPEPPVEGQPDEPATVSDGATAVGGATAGSTGAISDDPPTTTSGPAADAPAGAPRGPAPPPEEPAPRAVQVARAFAFPISLLVAVAAFLVTQWWVDRRDPKLLLAPDDPPADLLSFE